MTSKTGRLRTGCGGHSRELHDLLHGLIIRAVEKPLDWLLVSTSGSVEILLCLVLAAAVTLLLAWSPFDRALRWYRSGLAQFVTNRIALFTPSRSTARH